MPTVSEIDGKLDELKRQAAALKEQRKVAAAKEREQARKWKAATLAAIGETVLKTLGADWTAIDLEGLQGWLADNAEDIRLMAVTDTRTPMEAKEVLLESEAHRETRCGRGCDRYAGNHRHGRG